MILTASCAAGLLVVSAAGPSAQIERLPSARLVPAPPLTLPGVIDSNIPMVWDLVDGSWRLFAFTSWGGTPSLLAGPALDQMRESGAVTLVPDPGNGIWIQSVVTDEGGTWYGYYHHERPAEECGRPDRFILRLGAARSRDRGHTWEDLGIILEAPSDTLACASPNLYVIGGVGDVSVMLTPDRQDLYLFFSQYSKIQTEQGIAVARLAWADRDAPVGRLAMWVAGAWLPPRRGTPAAGDDRPEWVYPAGTPLAQASKPFHDEAPDADTFWGPSVHWNRYLERYVMLLNRARDEEFNNDGIYISYARTLQDPRVWTPPRKLLNHGEWYPQVAGLDPVTGTDKEASQRARFFLQGHSRHYIEFQR